MAYQSYMNRNNFYSSSYEESYYANSFSNPATSYDQPANYHDQRAHLTYNIPSTHNVSSKPPNHTFSSLTRPETRHTNPYRNPPTPPPPSHYTPSSSSNYISSTPSSTYSANPANLNPYTPPYAKPNYHQPTPYQPYQNRPPSYSPDYRPSPTTTSPTPDSTHPANKPSFTSPYEKSDYSMIRDGGWSSEKHFMKNHGLRVYEPADFDEAREILDGYRRVDAQMARSRDEGWGEEEAETGYDDLISDMSDASSTYQHNITDSEDGDAWSEDDDSVRIAFWPWEGYDGTAEDKSSDYYDDEEGYVDDSSAEESGEDDGSEDVMFNSDEGYSENDVADGYVDWSDEYGLDDDEDEFGDY